ncbi:MAG: protein kinase [Acidipropionibacterium acidipropionici]|nr:protein kinase [Acidipropionibacterium acidipropionici]
MGEIFSGRYELVDPLGRGGSGDVWRVWDHRDSRYLAGKVLQQSDSASLLRFVRETGWRFDHPHIVAPLGWVGEDDRIMFSMPLVHGGAVSALLSERGALPPGYVAGIADQMLDALEVIHEAGLVHRDLKPANILMEPNPSGLPDARLADFGIAAKVGEPRMTRVAEVVGTPGFMSPEARMGADPEPAQDIYSLGVVMAQLLTASRPSGEDPPVLSAEQRATPLGHFITACLADVTRRFPSAAEARKELSQVRSGLGLARIAIPDRTPALPPGWGPDGPDNSTKPLPGVRPATRGPRITATPSPLSRPSVPKPRLPLPKPVPAGKGSGGYGPPPAGGMPPNRGPRPATWAPSPGSGPRPSVPAPQSPASVNMPRAKASSGATAKDIVLGAGITAGLALVVIVILLLVF